MSQERPIKKPKMEPTHIRLLNDHAGHISDKLDTSLTADKINEWIPVFAETDADKRPDFPPQNAYLPPEMTFEEYSKYLSITFKMKKEKGIVEARAFTPGEKGWVWGTTPHAYVHKLFELVGADRDAEILIFGSEGEDYFESIGVRNCYRDASKPFVAMDEGDPDYNWTLYEHQYHDGTHDIEAQVNIDIPTIGVWQGGAFHSDLFLLCDITVATENAWCVENHFRINMIPGDGVQIPWRMFMGQKRFAYAELTGEVITARKALQFGMINEIVADVDEAYKRAWEIAELIMHSGSRQTRRLTTQIIRRPLKEAVAAELRGSFATEMWNTLSEESPHHPVYWETAKAQARAVMAAEKKGKIVKPRIGPFVEEDLY